MTTNKNLTFKSPERILVLGLETTCDETGAAVLAGKSPPGSAVPLILSSVVASQIAIHARFGGVVPEIASREHVRQILPVIDQALNQAGVLLEDLDAIAVAVRPGLIGSLIVGLTAAKSLAMALEIPLVAVDHLEAHLYACQLAHPEASIYPCLGLVISGGHSSLYVCETPLQSRFLGGTIDDAAGEAFDKVASLLGLGYPGGPEIDRLAKLGNPRAFAFPRAFLDDDRLSFSFSGLKTAVLQALRGKDARSTGVSVPAQLAADIAASFQEAIVDTLLFKVNHALEQTGMRTLGVGGGVAINSRFRERINEFCQNHRIALFIPPLSLCTDNAAMSGIAIPKLLAGETASLDIDVKAGLVRPRP